VLADDRVREYVQTQATRWRSQGVSSVPTMIINHEITITGAQPMEAYKQLLAERIQL
jgi:predicted DsbA family dithiol-disulfide isomerase